jgi:hypothetical protein
MAFVNEYVSAEDANKYDLNGINRRFGKDTQIRFEWTIDRERDVFLRWIASGREEFASRVTMVLWYQGITIPVHLEVSGTGDYSKPTTTIWHLSGIELPPALEAKRDEVLQSLREALTTYKVGVGVDVADHTAVFEF